MREWVTGRAASIPALDHLWSLALEEQVYLAWPFIVGLPRWGILPRFFLAIIGLSFAWKVVTMLLRQSIELRYGWTLACLDAFAAGGLVAWASRDAVWSPALSGLA